MERRRLFHSHAMKMTPDIERAATQVSMMTAISLCFMDKSRTNDRDRGRRFSTFECEWLCVVILSLDARALEVLSGSSRLLSCCLRRVSSAFRPTRCLLSDKGPAFRSWVPLPAHFPSQ